MDALLVLLIVLGLLAWLSSLGVAYFQGRVDAGKRCCRLLDASHKAQRQEMATLRRKLVDIGCIEETG